MTKKGAKSLDKDLILKSIFKHLYNLAHLHFEPFRYSVFGFGNADIE